MKNLFKRKKASAFYKGEDVKDIFTQKFDGEAEIETFVTELPISFQAIPENLSKREHFAGLAMMGFSANPDLTEVDYEEMADIAVRQADALIKGLEKK